MVLPDVTIGKNCYIKNAIIDKGCEILEGTIIGQNVDDDKNRFYVSPKGVVLVTGDMLGQEIHHVR